MNISLAPQVLFEIGGLPITNTLWVSFFISLLLIGVVLVVRRNMKEVPGTLQLFAEEVITFFHQFVKDTIPSKKVQKWFFPLFATLALFFLTANLLSFIPGLGAITYNGENFYRTATSDYGLIFVLTLLIFVLVQFMAIKVNGILGYIGQFINFKSPLAFVMGLLDIIGELAKVVSLSFRLFGNMFASEVLAIILLSLVPFLAPVPVSLLGLLTAVIQALVFAILASVYLSMAMTVSEEES